MIKIYNTMIKRKHIHILYRRRALCWESQLPILQVCEMPNLYVIFIIILTFLFSISFGGQVSTNANA